MTVEQLSASAETSVATVNRFIKQLGFAGFPEFKASLVKAFQASLENAERADVRPAPPESLHGGYKASLAACWTNIAAARSSADDAKLDAIINAILNARRVYVTGLGPAAFVAGYLQFGLDLYLGGNVSISSSSDGDPHQFRQLVNARPGDLAIGVSLPPYPNVTSAQLKMAKGLGVTTLLITDGIKSPMVHIADHVIFAPVDAPVLFNSTTAIFAVAEALVSVIARQRPLSLETAKRLIEHTAQLYDFNFEGPRNPAKSRSS